MFSRRPARTIGVLLGRDRWISGLPSEVILSPTCRALVLAVKGVRRRKRRRWGMAQVSMRDVIDGRWIYYAVNREHVTHWQQWFAVFFDPSRIQERPPRRAT